MAQENYVEGCSMQIPPFLEPNGFCFWKGRFETYVKSKDINLWQVIQNSNFYYEVEDLETKLMKETMYELLEDDQDKKLGKNNEANMTLYNTLPRKEFEIVFMCKIAKEKFSISNEETIDNGFIDLTLLAKVTKIKEAKDLATLPVDELVGNHKVYEMILENDGVVSKNTTNDKKGNVIGRNLKKDLDDIKYEDDVSKDIEIKDDDLIIRRVLSNINTNVDMVENLATNVDNEILVPFDENLILNPDAKGASEVRNESSSVKNVVRNTICDADMLDSANGMMPKSFISTTQGMSDNGNNKLSKIPVRVNEKGNKVMDMDPLLEEGSKRWDLTLVEYFVRLKMCYSEIVRHLRRMWRTHQLGEIITNEYGLYFLKFRSVKGMNFVLENRSWLVKGKPLFVQKWEAGLCMEKPKPTKVPLWVKILNVPLKAWNVYGISRITSKIGNPIIMDRITTSMCDRAYGRASFARVLIEVDATQELADSVEICYSSIGK
nr:zinc knuckle CX2CX4HX4C [Tanacetum cinerariifolium]